MQCSYSSALQEDDHANEELEIIATSSITVSTSCEEENNKNVPKTVTLEGYRQETVDELAKRQRFTVTREDGMEELKKDILGC